MKLDDAGAGSKNASAYHAKPSGGHQMRRIGLADTSSVPTILGWLCLCIFVGVITVVAETAASETPLDIGGRLELFVDTRLIGSLDGVSLRLHEPVQAGVALAFDKPWEGAFCGYCTVLHDGGLYRMYYRGLPIAGQDGSTNEVTCYAESKDGIVWTKPVIGLYDAEGSRRNNIILKDMAPFSHNFSPFIDTRPGVPPS
jgi:hypothetical protein